MTIDLSGRYQEAFGMVTSANSRHINLQGFSGNNSEEVFVTGDVSFETVELYNHKHRLIFGNMLLPSSNGIGSVFAPPPLFAFSKEKKIATTTIDYDNDIVMVERYGVSPWSITMQGLLIDMENHTYPSRQVRKLREVFNINDRFNVAGLIFADLNIDSIYFTNFQIQGVQGFADTMSYTLEAKSIKDVGYELIKV